jgi:hypothetical protein
VLHGAASDWKVEIIDSIECTGGYSLSESNRELSCNAICNLL